MPIRDHEGRDAIEKSVGGRLDRRTKRWKESTKQETAKKPLTTPMSFSPESGIDIVHPVSKIESQPNRSFKTLGQI
jgi:hypothetical protein